MYDNESCPSTDGGTQNGSQNRVQWFQIYIPFGLLYPELAILSHLGDWSQPVLGNLCKHIGSVLLQKSSGVRSKFELVQIEMPLLEPEDRKK